MLEGVVQRGTGQALKAVGKPVAGKTGTTNDERDAWFIGYTPDLTVGVYVGFDKPRPMGAHAHRRRARGADRSAISCATRCATSRRRRSACPPASSSSRSIRKTGQRAAYGDPNVILEAFKPGEGPPAGHR